MRNKILLSLTAIIVIVGGVAAMSAFEAHVINVTAHIENALSVSTKEILFGTVFPQEYLEKDFTINLSSSFLTEDRVDDVEYDIVQKPKPKDPVDWQYCLQNPTDYTRCYYNLCPFLSKIDDQNPPNDNDGESYYQDPTGNPYCTTPGDASGRLSKLEGDISDTWTVDLKVPPVEGYVGQDWPTGCPTIPVNEEEWGCDLWVEVSGISECIPTTEVCDGVDNDCDGEVDEGCDYSLVGYWGFNEGVGDTAYDSSGNGNHCLIDGAVWQEGGLGFDGTDIVDCGTGPSLNVTGDKLTVESWIKSPGGMGWLGGGVVEKNGFFGLYDGGYFTFIGDGGFTSFNVVTTGGWYYWYTTVPITDNNWHHFVGVYDGSTIKLYIDGVLNNMIGSLPGGNILPTATPFLLGFHDDALPHAYIGLLDEVRVYSRALDGGEILNHYLAGH